jgi:hypothetical protein
VFLVASPARLLVFQTYRVSAEAAPPFWNGFFFPKGTPRAIVLKMNKAHNETIALPRDVGRWSKVIRDAGLAGTAGK